MATSTSVTNVNGNFTRIESTDQLPVISGQPIQRRPSNTPACGCSNPSSPDPDATALVLAVAAANQTRRFPTATLTSGVYRSGLDI